VPHLCRACDLLLDDGVEYRFCPACDLAVDRVGPPRFEEPAEETPPHRPDAIFTRVVGALWVSSLVPVSMMALNAEFRLQVLATVGPFVLLPVALSVLFLKVFFESWPELRKLLGSRDVRIVHGLEHATLRVLEERGHTIHGGRTTGESFEIDVDYRVGAKQVRRAFREAVRRIRRGEWSLAYDRRCGTSLLVGLLLASLAGVALGVLGLFTTLTPSVVVVLLVAVAVVMILGVAPFGLLAQLLFTVSTRFGKAGLHRVVRRHADEDDDVARYEVRVWIVPSS
jgi:hypothetical protein